MLKKILAIFSFFMLFFAFSLNAQVKTYFGGTLNIFGSSGSSPKYTIQGFFNDTSGEYPLDSITVGDIIYVSEGSTCVRLSVDTINSSAGGILDADVSDIDTILVSPPSGIGALMHETPNNSLPRYIPGLSETLLGCIRTHMTGKIDEGIAGGESTWLKPALEADIVTIDSNNTSFIIDSTSTTKITAVGTAQGDMIVSGSSSLPSSLSHIVGTDTSQFNISGSNGIDITTGATSGVNIDSPNGITINSNVYIDKQDFRLYHDPNIDGSQFGYRAFITPTIRNIYMGDIGADFNGTSFRLYDQSYTVEANGSYGSGLKIVGDVTTIGDYANENDETRITLDVNGDVVFHSLNDFTFEGDGWTYNMATSTPPADGSDYVMIFSNGFTYFDKTLNGIINALPAGNVTINAGTNVFRLRTTNDSNYYFEDSYSSTQIQTSPTNYGFVEIEPAIVTISARADADNYTTLSVQDDVISFIGATAASNWQYNLTRTTPSANQVMYWPTPTTPAFTDLPISENGHSILDSLPYGNIRFGANNFQLRLDTAAFRIENPSSSFNFTSSTWSLRAGDFSGLVSTFTGNDEEVKITWADVPNNDQNTISVSDVGISFQGFVNGDQYGYKFPLISPVGTTDSLRRVISWGEIKTGRFEVFNGGNYRTADVSGNILASDDYIEVNPNITVHLPIPSTLWTGKRYVIIAGGGTGGANPGTIDVVGGGSTIELGSSLTLDNAFESYTLVCNGSIWIIINNKP